MGRGERIRTSGPYVPNVVLYQAELLPGAAGVIAAPKRHCNAGDTLWRWCRRPTCDRRPPVAARRGGGSSRAKGDGAASKGRRRLGTPLPNSQAANSQAASWRSRSEEHTSELQSLMRISYAVFCLKKKKPE